MITSKLQNYKASCGAVPNAWKAFTVAVVIDDQISIRWKESNGASLFKPFPLWWLLPSNREANSNLAQDRIIFILVEEKQILEAKSETYCDITPD